MGECVAPFQLHADWPVLALGELCAQGGGDVQTGPFGSQLHKSDYVEIGIPSVMPVNIGDNRINTEGIARITEEDAKRLSRYRLKAGDIVYSRRGDVERRALVRTREEGWLCGTGCLRVRVGNGVADPVYASYYLGHPSIRAWISRHAIGATMPNLNTSIMAALPFVLPPLSEQKAIAHILGTLDDKIELNRRINETLEAIARAIFKSWFVDFGPVRAKAEGRDTGLPKEIEDLFPDGFENSELGEIPKGWKVGSVSDLVDITSGKRPRSRSPSRTADMSIPLWGGNGPMAFVDTALYEQPILLTGRVGTLGSVFRITEPCWPSDNTLVMLPKDQAALPYVYLALLRMDFSALNRGSTQPLLAQSDLKKQRLICPGLPIIKAFHAMVENCFRWQDVGARQGLRLRDTRQGLIPRLLAGVFRIPEGPAT